MAALMPVTDEEFEICWSSSSLAMRAKTLLAQVLDVGLEKQADAVVQLDDQKSGVVAVCSGMELVLGLGSNLFSAAMRHGLSADGEARSSGRCQGSKDELSQDSE